MRFTDPYDAERHPTTLLEPSRGGQSAVLGEREVTIPAGHLQLPGTLAWPEYPSGVVLFAQGSGSSRRSPRNLALARQLRSAGLATLLFDLLTPTEAEQADNRFAIRSHLTCKFPADQFPADQFPAYHFRRGPCIR